MRLSFGPLTLKGNVDIVGPQNRVVVYGINQFGIFSISSGATVSLENLTIARGSAIKGGGISNEGTLNVINSYIENNNVRAIREDGVVNSRGGGIYNVGDMTLVNSTIRDNVATSIAWNGYTANFYGGGIYNSGNLRINSSTISYNSAVITSNVYPTVTSYGGGIYNSGTLTVNNSTFSNNTADGTSESASAATSYGGGIYTTGTAAVTNSTLANNVADDGGGISNSGNITVNNTIVANNSNGDVRTEGTGTVNGSYNLISDDSEITGEFNQNNVDPRLGELRYNGGPTKTLALLAGSPAFNAGSNSLAVDANGNALPTDQRGYQRIEGGTVDMGAYEVQPADQIDMFIVSLVDYGDADGLRFGELNSMMVKLSHTEESIDQKSWIVAYNQLNSFSKQLVAGKNKKVFSEENTANLLQMTEDTESYLLPHYHGLSNRKLSDPLV